MANPSKDGDAKPRAKDMCEWQPVTKRGVLKCNHTPNFVGGIFYFCDSKINYIKKYHQLYS